MLSPDEQTTSSDWSTRQATLLFGAVRVNTSETITWLQEHGYGGVSLAMGDCILLHVKFALRYQRIHGAIEIDDELIENCGVLGTRKEVGPFVILIDEEVEFKIDAFFIWIFYNCAL